MPADDPTGRRFGEAVDLYELGRPEYPDAIVDWLLDSRPERVVDLGAGSGKLTRALVSRAPLVVAVEPDAQMRAELSRALPGTSVVAGVGEDLPLRDGYADTIVAGQAWHWVDPARGSAEVARVLCPGGRLGLVWNDRDESATWLDELGGLLREFGTSPDADYQPVVTSPFGTLETESVRWTQHASVEVVEAMVASRSYVIALRAERRTELLERVRDLAAEQCDPATGLVPVPYVTHGYRVHRP